MIKFFRKIRYNLMETGKTGRYLKYAIGEIVLVVIGILIALQINNWNEAKKDKNSLHLYLSVIKENIENDLIVLDSLKTKRVAYTNYAKKEHLTFLNNTFDFYTALNAVTSFDEFYFQPNTSGLQALKNSPHLGQINGKTIYQLLIKYEAQLAAIAQTEKSLNEFIETLEAQLASKSDRSILIGYVSLSDKEKEDVNLTEQDIYNFAKSIKEFIEYRNVISQVSIQDKIIIPQYDALKEISLEVIDEIDMFITP